MRDLEVQPVVVGSAATRYHSPVLEAVRQRAGSAVIQGFFEGIARVAKLHPRAEPKRHDVEVIRNVPYTGSGRSVHLLDVYRPIGTRPGTSLPAVLYVHGGGFRILSKDTHWVMGLALARERFVVFNVNYTLSEEAPFPAAVDDVADAYRWVAEHAHEYGGDVSRLVVAGESAGANLATTLTIAATFERPEPGARRVYDTGVVPIATMPACGILQVTDPARFSRRRPDLSPVVQDRIDEVSKGYLRGHGLDPRDDGTLDLADPLVLLERDTTPTRPLPPFFVPCGTADPLLDDTRRLAAALRKRGVTVDDRYYPGGVHAFHAFVFRKQARECWGDTYRFLRTHVPR